MTEQLRREPFRILFPLGALLAWAAVLPWVLFGTGFIRTWLGAYHALTMTQAFLVAMAFGFLGTMLPRRTGAAPLSTAELAIVIVALVAIPSCLLADSMIGAQLAYLTALGTLVQFALRRVRRAGRPPHPSFVFLPLGLVGGMVGSIFLIVSTLGPPVLLAPGRALVEEGLLLSLVMAMAPMLTSLITQGKALPDPPEQIYRRQRALHLLAGAIFFASYAVQFAASERAGLFLRGAVLAIEVVLGSRIDRAPSVNGLHRRLYRIALAFVPLGLLAASLQPAYRVPSLHLTFVGGLSLLVFAVSFHVVFLHTQRDALAAGRPWPVALIGALVLVAACARASAEHFSQHYFEALAIASSLWLAGALVWGMYLLRMIVTAARPPRAPT
jgi:uncharacterized protein involved in response to NO